MGITRKQLKNFGATDYLVKRLIKSLQPTGKKGRAYEYGVEQMLDSIRSMMDAPRIRKTTQLALAHLEVKVSGIVKDVTPDKQMLEAMRRVGETNARFEQTAREFRKIAKEFQTYRRKRSHNFSSQNNIVVFTS